MVTNSVIYSSMCSQNSYLPIQQEEKGPETLCPRPWRRQCPRTPPWTWSPSRSRHSSSRTSSGCSRSRAGHQSSDKCPAFNMKCWGELSRSFFGKYHYSLWWMILGGNVSSISFCPNFALINYPDFSVPSYDEKVPQNPITMDRFICFYMNTYYMLIFK